MTNNPTIDGVSRELIAIAEGFVLAQADAFPLISIPRGLRSEALDQVARELRALLDAPAVERQEPVDALSKGFYTTQSGGGNYSINIGFRTIAEMQSADKQMLEVLRSRFKDTALQSTIAQLEDKLNKAIDLDFQRRETIEQLQARVQELESGRGEPVAWVNGEQLKLCAVSPREVEPDNPMIHNLPRNIAGSALKTDYCNTPLFTAPQAPVAVLLPERKQYVGQGVYPDGHEWACANSEVTGWNACLDATAALNNKPSTEVNP